MSVSRVGGEMHQGVLNAPQSLADNLPYRTAWCMSLASALHLVELLKKILLVLWEKVFGLIRSWLLGGLVCSFDGVGVLVWPLILRVLLVVSISCVLCGFVVGGPIWRGFPRVVVGCGLSLLLGPPGRVGRCWNLAFTVRGARVS